MAFELAFTTMVVFFLILAVGFAAGKFGIITREAMPNLAGLCTNILLPSQLFYSTYVNITSDMLVANLPMLALSVGFYLIIGLVTFGIAKVLRLPHDKDRVFMLCFMFGNTGFVGFPLLSTLFPGTGLLYLSLFTVVDQLLFWTFGSWLATARDRDAHFHPRSILSPNIIMMATVFTIIFIGLPLPKLLVNALSTLSNATTAICMMYLGAMLCFSKWARTLRRPEVYVGIVVKMVALPVLAALAFRTIGLPTEMSQAMTIIMALPVMTVVPMVARAHGNEGDYATGITAVTLLACVATIPLVTLIAV